MTFLYSDKDKTPKTSKLSFPYQKQNGAELTWLGTLPNLGGGVSMKFCQDKSGVFSDAVGSLNCARLLWN